MSTIEELLATPQVEEVWEVDNRYVINSSYSDDQGPIEIVGKDIGDMSSQISIQGESISQYVEFIMPRYYDNIDLSEKNIVIHYTARDRGGENAPINVYKSQERIKFGWAIPASATANEGTLSIGIWARGYVGTEEYMWKSRIAYYKVERGPVLGEGLSEPDVQWYLDFVREMDAKVTEASLYSTRAKQSENVAVESKESAIASSQAASGSANTAVRKAAEASSSASAASAHSATAKVSADNAKESETKAQGYAEEARNNAEGFEPISDMMTGESPTATNSTNAPLVSLKVKGYTEQFTTTGKNLLKNTASSKTAYGITLTVNNDKSITINGTATQDFIAKIGEFNDKDDSYILTGCPSGGSKSSYYLVASCRDENNEWKADNVDVGSGETLSNDYAKRIIQIGVKSEKTVSNLTFYPMVRLASISDSTYEPYTNGASPNPDYPQEINGLAKDGAIEVKTTGKNMLNNTASSKTLYGITVTVNDNKSVTLDGTATQDFIVTIGEFNNIDDNYILSGCPSGGSKSSYYLVASYRDENNEWKADDLELGNEKKLSNNYAKRLIQIGVKSGATVPNLTFYPMIRKETITDNTYEPYTETTAAIPTEPLYEGDYLEVYADGSGKLVRKMGVSNSLVLSSESQNVMTLTKEVRYKKPTDMTDDSTTPFYSDIGRWVQSTYNRDEVGICGYTYGETVGFRVLIDTDVSALAPVIVYTLATPIETELTTEQVAEFKKLYTFEPVTNVLCDGEVEMIYFRNNPNGRVAGMLQRQIDSAVSILSSTEEV